MSREIKLSRLQGILLLPVILPTLVLWIVLTFVLEAFKGGITLRIAEDKS